MTSTLLRDARLVGGPDRPQDVLVADGVVTAIADSLQPGTSEVVELDGRYLGPGLWDHHVHFSQWALVSQRLDISAATSAAEAAGMIATHLLSQPDKAVQLVGFGFRDALWPDAPHRSLLDAVAPAVPVVLMSGDLHCVWLNSVALTLFGHPYHSTGVLREQDAFAVNTALSTIPDDLLDRWVDEAATAAAARGVVGIVDLEMSLTLDSWTRRVAAGTGRLRVDCGVYPEDLEAVIARGLRTGDALPGTDGLIRMGPFKIIIDGSLNTRTAACHDPFSGFEHDPNPNGLLAYEFDELVAYLRRASSNGIVPAVHAIGDLANQLALDAFEAAGVGGGIEHAQLIAVTDFARFASLGVTASVQPEHAMDDRDIADLLWAGRTDRAFAFASLVEAGVTLHFGSDAPVAPLDPWVTMAAALSRSRDGRESWHPEQRTDARTSYAASTDGRTAVAVGDVADLVVTELDPLIASDVQLRSMPVFATMLGGEWTFRLLR
ncbi:amidohydrolase family protein [Glaciihabitans sp. UYNi722]|uniref:amidohydrolase n=1 Tax=Glaciihabitans sp. UYNi722 TaxID=3156344 RepID=UPI00339624B8